MIRFAYQHELDLQEAEVIREVPAGLGVEFEEKKVTSRFAK
jgi:hypothetical protein